MKAVEAVEMGYLTTEVQKIMEGKPDRVQTMTGEDVFCKYHKLTLNIHDHQQINSKKTFILMYIFLLLAYIGIQLGLLSCNFKSQEFIEDTYYYSFHLIEFWAVFIFTVLEAFILFVTGNVNADDFLGVIQLCILSFNVVSTLVCAIMVSIDLSDYEVPTHFMEYSIQILITAIDFLFIFRFNGDQENKMFKYSKFVFASCICFMSWVQIFIYAGSFPTGGMEAERAAHFCEFSVESANALFALMFGYQLYNKYSSDLDCHEQNMRAIAINTII